MAPTQRIKVANEKASKNITLRGNVPKSTVSLVGKIEIFSLITSKILFCVESMFSMEEAIWVRLAVK